MTDSNRLNELLTRYLHKTGTEAERQELFALVQSPEHDDLLSAAAGQINLSGLPEEYLADHVSNHIYQAILVGGEIVAARPAVHRIHFLKTAWFRYAAILILIAGTATLLYYYNKPQKEIAKTALIQKPTDIAPGGNRAILTLADGHTILLDSAANGTLASQGSTQIIKLDAGSLAYNNGRNGTGFVGMNTIRTPKGGQYQVTLPDGSKVWLNAESSIRFPTAFVKDRTVDITGEVYFEIASDNLKPFTVQVGATNVQVLGTSFNINAYPDEAAIKTTLIEGRVRVNAYKHLQVLAPRQQAQVTAQEIIKIVNNADIEKVLAWKNGLFNFEGATLEDVMKQLKRWYDIEVVYEKNIPDIQFVGEMAKDIPLSGLLNALERSDVHFRMDGRKLIVLP